ncbi:MAG TPA: phage virion morphogenesis protein [Candidatus Omnitrophota bacterium]|nr:phage virion morphogenesis protein [Candidatus Omnitrophota bacterium]
MATLPITVTDGPAIDALAQLAQRSDDLTPFFTEWGAALVTSTVRRFDSQTDPDGLPWAPLALSTLKRKKGRGKILQLSGILRQSITYRASRTMLEVGTPMIYGRTHQFGARIERHAQTVVGGFRKWRDVTVTRDDGSTYTAKRFAGPAHKRISMMARMEIGAGTIEVPARPFLGLSEADQRRGARIVGRYLLGAEA